MEDKCIDCQWNGRPKYSFPCSRCLSENMKYALVTCMDCRQWWGCSKRGKFKRRLQPCDWFEWD